MHLLAFSRDEVQIGHVAQGTRPSFQNLLDSLGWSFMLSVVFCGPLFIFWSDSPTPFYSLFLPFLSAFPFFSMSPPFYKTFIYLLWLLRVFVAFCSCCEQGLLFIVVCRPLIVMASLVAEHGLEAHRLMAALQHVGSSWTRDWTHVPSLSRQILNHCIREVSPVPCPF